MGSKKKMSQELDDANLELDSHRNKVLELEKKQRNFDKILTEEKLNGERISAERDNAERDAREKETKLLNLNRELGTSSSSSTNQRGLVVSSRLSWTTSSTPRAPPTRMCTSWRRPSANWNRSSTSRRHSWRNWRTSSSRQRTRRCDWRSTCRRSRHSLIAIWPPRRRPAKRNDAAWPNRSATSRPSSTR